LGRSTIDSDFLTTLPVLLLTFFPPTGLLTLTNPRDLVVERLTPPITLPMREPLLELARLPETGTDLFCAREYTSTVRLTLELLIDDFGLLERACCR
jgi:hypothetical protein